MLFLRTVVKINLIIYNLCTLHVMNTIMLKMWNPKKSDMAVQIHLRELCFKYINLMYQLKLQNKDLMKPKTWSENKV